MTLSARDIETAARTLHGQIVRTPLVGSPRLSALLGAELLFKLESQQYTGSFKDRGACCKLQQLRQQATPCAGVIAASAGNHAQGVAFHARRLGIPALIVMPQTTPFSKVERTELLGAAIVLHGASLSEAYEHAQVLAGQKGLALVHPYDDPAIVAGQGTVGLEMLADRPDLDVLVVPIGGGGLIGGIALWAKAQRPSIRVIGVQSELCPSMHAARRGQTVPLRTGTIADGIAVKVPGVLTRTLVQQLVDDIVLVSEAAIERGMQLLLDQQKIVAEGAGAAAFAAVLADPAPFAGNKVGIVVSGGNVDARLLSTVLLRGLQRDGKIARVRIDIDDSPGVLSRVARLIGSSGADIIDIEHQRLFSAVLPRQAELDVVMETRGRAHVERILQDLAGDGFQARPF
ncbi:MAG TPA: threonine ammonia-lyase [Planctomycetota bacterium]|nr:threonine ammonia-lyase [Planctomycetota bacterium]